MVLRSVSHFFLFSILFMFHTPPPHQYQALGAVHVLTGPDHLSALATLSANLGRAAFCLGIRWGLGHSTGLLLVGVIFIALSHQYPTTHDETEANDGNDEETVQVPDGMTHAFEAVIGVFMLFLGLYGIFRAIDKKQKADADTDAKHDANEDMDDDAISLDFSRHQNSALPTTALVDASCQSSSSIPPQPVVGTMVSHSSNNNNNEQDLRYMEELSYQNHVNLHLSTVVGSKVENESGGGGDDRIIATGGPDNINTTNASDNPTQSSPCSKWKSWVQRHVVNRLSPRTLSILTGILHGLAGPGGVLAIIPAVQLRNAKLATIYLGSFCVTSTITMGLFATLYGVCSQRLAAATTTDNSNSVPGSGGGPPTSQRIFQIEIVSSCFSFLVGILWLVLLAIGKMDVVFP